ncbi:MAG TPA: ATPase domain-containing protein [Thermoanaerobaculia bacterium]
MSERGVLVASTGIDGLDDILGGGLPRDRAYVFQGSPGVGKTTIGLQFLLEGHRAGEKGLFVTLSESAEELRGAAGSHGWSLEAIPLHEITPSGEESNGEADNTLFQPAEVELGETTRSILREVERINPSRVVIDSLSEVRLLSQSALRYRRQILALKKFFAERRCTALFLDDAPTEGSDIHLQTIAHGVVNLEQLAPLYGADRRRLRVLKLRGVKFRGGFHDFKIETGGVVVYPRLIAAEHHGHFVREQVSSGIPQIDQLLGGGLDRGTTSLILGPAGTGKSAIAAQYAAAAASRGEPVVIFTFDEGLGTLFARTRALRIPLDEQIEKGRIRVQQIDPAELSPGEFTALVRHSIEEFKARMIVIDSLNGYYNAMPEENLLAVQLHELFTYLRQRGVLVIVTMAQHGLIGPAMGTPIDVSYLADTVILLRYFEAEGEIRKAISIMKKRSGSHESYIRPLTLDSSGLRVGDPLKEFTGILSGTPVYSGSPLLKESERDGG